MIDRGPEDERQDLVCQECDSVYFDIEIGRAQKLHKERERCGGTLRELTDDDD